MKRRAPYPKGTLSHSARVTRFVNARAYTFAPTICGLAKLRPCYVVPFVKHFFLFILFDLLLFFIRTYKRHIIYSSQQLANSVIRGLVTNRLMVRYEFYNLRSCIIKIFFYRYIGGVIYTQPINYVPFICPYLCFYLLCYFTVHHSPYITGHFSCYCCRYNIILFTLFHKSIKFSF